MAYSAAVIIATIGEFLHDTGNVIWSGATICKHVSEAQNLIAGLRPDATATTAPSHTLSASSKQTLPAGGLRLLDIPQNASGAPVRKTDREMLTEAWPTWNSDTGTEIEFYMYDPENPGVFWVAPVPSGTVNVALIYSAAPDDFGTESTDISLQPTYITAIFEWVLYRCFSMETKGMDMGEASIHLSNFYNVMGVKAKNEIMLQQIQEAT